MGGRLQARLLVVRAPRGKGGRRNPHHSVVRRRGGVIQLDGGDLGWRLKVLNVRRFDARRSRLEGKTECGGVWPRCGCFL
jgi:hypothetical protein